MEKKTNIIKEDIIVSKVINDPNQTPDALMIFGFTGKSGVEGHLRLYLTPQLDDFVDIPTENIYNNMEVPPPLSYFGGSLLWIKKQGELVHRDTNQKEFKAPFIEGREKNGKNPETYADVLKNMYGSPIELKPDNKANSNFTQNATPPVFDAAYTKQMLSNMFTLFTQKIEQQQSIPQEQPNPHMQPPGIQPPDYSLGFPADPHEKQVHNTNFYSMPNTTASPPGINRGQEYSWAQQQKTDITDNKTSPNHRTPQQPVSAPTNQFPEMESWPPIPENIRQNYINDQQFVNNYSIRKKDLY